MTKTWHKFNKVSRSLNEFKVKWYMPGWHVPSMINVWTKYGEPRLYGYGETDVFTKIWHKFNQVSSVKMRSRSDYTWLADMYIPWTMCGPSIVSLGCMLWRNWYKHKNLTSLHEKQYLCLAFSVCVCICGMDSSEIYLNWKSIVAYFMRKRQ